MLLALRQRKTHIEWNHLEEVLTKVLVGWQPTEHEFDEETLYRIAVHEMGHALISMKCQHHAKVVQVVIQLSSPTSPGYTQFERTLYPIHTKETLMEHLMILLAGRIAEECLFGQGMSTGATDDLEKAHHLAYDMVTVYGMGQDRKSVV